MRILLYITFASLFLIGPLYLADAAYADDNVGSIISLRGNATIIREQQSLQAQVRDGVLFNDTIKTYQASRAKMLFIDDSILTLGENSNAVIKDFLYGQGTENKSIFQLIDGTMRAIVGKTNFEVHTPTAVAAARGTVILFETGIENGKQYTRIVCIEGHVYARSTYPTIVGSVKIEPGQMTTVFDGEPLSAPIITPPHMKERLLSVTDVSQYELPLPKPVALKKIKEGMLHKPSLNRIVNDAPLQTQDPGVRGVTPVTIDIQFPD